MQESAEPVQQHAPGEPRPRPWPKRLVPFIAGLERLPWRVIGALAGIALFATALFVLEGVLRHVHYADVRKAFQAVETWQIGLSLLFTAFSYVALTGYDVFGLRHIGRRDVPYRTAALSAFTGYALAYTIGFQVFVAAAVRYRTYAEAGLSAAEVAGLTLVSGLTFWLGIILVLGIGLSWKANELAFLDTLGPVLNRTVGIILLLAMAAYLGWLFGKRRHLNAFGFRLPLPGFGSTISQLGIGVADIIGASAALYVLLPTSPELTFTVFTAIFIVALCLGMASHAPGGVGVIEATMLIALPSVGADRLLAALLLWRITYYLLPFLLALLLLALLEFTRRRGLIARTSVALAVTMRPVAPVVSGVAVFAAGAAALVLNVFPPGSGRLALTERFIPLPLFEAADLATSILAISLMLLSRGLLRRIAKAFRFTRLLLIVGIATSLLKGLDWETAGICLAALLLLQVNRRAFFRREGLSHSPLGVPWLAAVVTIFLGALWLGSLINVPFGNASGWLWQFGWSEETPRVFRGLAAAFLVGSGLVLAAFGRQRREPAFPSEVVRLTALDPRADTSRALDGNHRFLLSAERDAFIQYDVRGRSWIALGDAVGAAGRQVELCWAFRDLAERHGGWPVFFNAAKTRLPLFRELGLASLNYGEDAALDLAGYQAPAVRPFETAGAPLSVRIVPAGRVAPLMQHLREIEPAWPNYAAIEAFSLVLASRNGRPVAFARLLRGSGAGEMALDDVYSREEKEPALLYALLEAAIAEAKREGYARFDLGTAPLPAPPEEADLPRLDRDALGLFRYGEFFADLADLRSFKQAFDPTWTARYLACPGGLALPQVLRDIAAVCARA